MELCRVEAHYGSFDIDLFASRVNRKVQCYMCLSTKPVKLGTILFFSSLDFIFMHSFQHYLMSFKQKRNGQHNVDYAVIVVCKKIPVWFPKLITLLIYLLIFLVDSKQVLKNLYHLHPILTKFNMMAF